MSAQIRPNRMEVNDRFPMLGFAVRTDEPNVDAEVVLATDIALFQPQSRASRTAANFYSTREHGVLGVPRGEGVFVVPPEVLARFIGHEKLYFGLATGRLANGGLHIDALPREGSPYVSLRGFTGRTLRRGFGSGRSASAPVMEWTGDAARPGSEPSNGSVPRKGNGGAAGNGAIGNGGAHVAGPAADYDDGFGPMPAIPARAASRGRAMSAPSARPSDQRDRALRIGGAFGDRIGQALDLGVPRTTVDPLLEVLERQARPAALGRHARPFSTRARAQNAQPWTINWDDIELIPQPTNVSCWAAAAAMIIGWRDRISLSPEAIAQICARSPEQGLQTSDHARFASEMGLVAAPPQSYSAEYFRQVLENNGPLWISKLVGNDNLHAVVVTGMYYDGSNYFVRIADPWDRAVGTPGAPGGYASTHATGSRYIMRYEDFQNEYELGITGDPPNVQILHAGGTYDHALNVGGQSPPSGYAMSEDGEPASFSPVPPPRARAMDGGVGAAITIGTFLITTLADRSGGDVTWDLDQGKGMKHPNDTPPANPGELRDGASIRLDDWPVAGGALDDISAWFQIDWQYDGQSLGNVRTTNIGTNDAVGWGLHVRGQIMDDNRVHPPTGCAALRVMFHYRFSRSIGSDVIALREITLYGDGTWESRAEWLQAEALSVAGRGRSARI